MPLPKQLSAWNNVLKETLAKGRAKFGAKKYSLKRGMKEASKIYKRMSKTAKKRGGGVVPATPVKTYGGNADDGEMGGDLDGAKKPEDLAPMAGGEADLEKPLSVGGSAVEEKKHLTMGGKKRRSSKKRSM